MNIEGDFQDEMDKESKPQPANAIVQGKAPAPAQAFKSNLPGFGTGNLPNVNQFPKPNNNLDPTFATGPKHPPSSKPAPPLAGGTPLANPPPAGKAPQMGNAPAMSKTPPPLSNQPVVNKGVESKGMGPLLPVPANAFPVNGIPKNSMPGNLMPEHLMSGNLVPGNTNPPQIPQETPTADDPAKIPSMKEEKKERYPQFNQPTASLEFLKTVRKYAKPNTSIQEIKEISKFFSSEQHPNLLCSKCNHFKLKLRLECSHNICLYCFSANVEAFKAAPSIKSFKKLSCPTCSLNFSNKDIKAVFLGPYQKQFLEIPLSRKCQICQYDRQLVVGYFTELPCLHLCKSCYANELYSKSKNCPCCQQPFISIKNTMNRLSKCAGCSKKDLMVEASYRSIHKDHMLCFRCLQDSARSKACESCNEGIDNSQLRYAASLLNKQCSVCSRKLSLVSLVSKECCPYFVCEDCQRDEDTCKVCFAQTVISSN